MQGWNMRGKELQEFLLGTLFLLIGMYFLPKYNDHFKIKIN
jgi:hypothetical protein